MISHFRRAWQFFKPRVLNRNFQEPVYIMDDQGDVWKAVGRLDVWRIAWRTTRKGKI